MNDETEKVLAMLENATIDAAEANELLEALQPADDKAARSPKMEVTAVPAHITDIPDMDRFRTFWRTPFTLLAGVTAVSAWWLRSITARRKPGSTLGALLVGGLFLTSLGLAVLTFLSRKSTWVHVRVQEKGGRKIAISLPIPLSLADQAIKLARQTADDEQLANLEMAAAALEAVQENFKNPDADPIMISVDDDDAQVQVFFG